MKVAPMNLVAAQALKDATMAHFIARHGAAGRLFLHFNGVYHSQRRGGICWYLARLQPRWQVVTLSCVAGDPPGFEGAHGGLGDVIFVTP